MKLVYGIFLAAFMAATTLNAAGEKAVRDTAFADAIAAYQADKFAEAAEGFRALLDQGEQASALYYNLGLAQKNLNHPADAALNFRRALLLDSRLLPARRALEDLSETEGLPTSPFSWQEELSGIVSPQWGLVGGSVIFWGGIFLLLLFAREKTRRPGFQIGAWVLIGVGLLAVAAFWLSDPYFNERDALLVTDGTPAVLRQTPSDNAVSVASLPPGSNLRRQNQSAGWTFARTLDGNEGWIPTKRVVAILPEAASSSARQP